MVGLTPLFVSKTIFSYFSHFFMSTRLIDKLNRYGSVAREFEVRLPGKAIEKITGRGNYKVPVNTTYMAYSLALDLF